MISYCRETFPSQEDVVDSIKSMLGMEDPSELSGDMKKVLEAPALELQ